MANVQKFVRLVNIKRSSLSLKVIGCIFPLLTGYKKTVFERNHGTFKKNKYYISGVDFQSALQGLKNGDIIIEEYVKLFPIRDDMIFTFNKDECVEVSLGNPVHYN